MQVYKFDKSNVTNKQTCVEYELLQHEECRCKCAVESHHCSKHQVHTLSKYYIYFFVSLLIRPTLTKIQNDRLMTPTTARVVAKSRKRNTNALKCSFQIWNHSGTGMT